MRAVRGTDLRFVRFFYQSFSYSTLEYDNGMSRARNPTFILRSRTVLKSTAYQLVCGMHNIYIYIYNARIYYSRTGYVKASILLASRVHLEIQPGGNPGYGRMDTTTRS